MNVAVPNDANTINRQTDSVRWHASIHLDLARVQDKTRLIGCRHEGPLRVQKPFVQDDGSCHIYLLHPPGGIAGGDDLTISVNAGAGTSSLLTSPSAGKFYRSNNKSQTMHVALSAEKNTHIEWLPMETIVFDGASALIDTRVQLDEGASYLGWEILCLGRRASGEQFDCGQVTQKTHIEVMGQLRHREHLQTSSMWQSSAWGMNGASVTGTLIALIPDRDQTSSLALVDALRVLFDAPENAPNLAVTGKGCTILVRYLGDSAEQCRALFESARVRLHELQCFTHSSGQSPRIWKT